MDKIAKEYPSVHALDVSTLLRILKIRQATANAQFNYSFVRLSMPVWLFEARESVQLSGPAWRGLLGDDVQVVSGSGNTPYDDNRFGKPEVSWCRHHRRLSGEQRTGRLILCVGFPHDVRCGSLIRSTELSDHTFLRKHEEP